MPLNVMSRPVYIYALTEPDQPWNVRYVGATVRPLNRRLTVHLSPSTLKDENYKNHWIKSLLRQGRRPQISLIDVTDSDNWKQIEAFYIKSYRQAGFKLTNTKDGGEGGGVGNHHSLEVRKSISEKLIGRVLSIDTRQKISCTRLMLYETHCQRGHERTPENHYVNSKGKKVCRDCRKKSMANYRLRKGS